MKPNDPSTNLPLLRLHIQPEDELHRQEMRDEPTISTLCEAFSRTTGWDLHYHWGLEHPAAAIWQRNSSINSPDSFGMCLLSPEGRKDVFPQKDAEELALRIFELSSELFRARHAIQARESELAARGPVIGHREPDAETMLHRLTAALGAAQELLEVDAAALYILDEQTQFLKLRAQSGLSSERFLRAPRILRGSKGDLEALTGHAVVIEGPDDLPYWSVPEKCASAVCVPVSTAHVPLGTLWCFCSEPRGFSDKQLLMLEVIAGRIAVELERESLAREMEFRLQECTLAQPSVSIDPSQASGEESSITTADSAIVTTTFGGDGWDFAGIPGLERGSSVSSSHVDLRFQGPQKLSFTAVQGMDKGVLGSAASHLAFGAIRSSFEQRPSTRLDHAHAILLETSTGEQLAAGICGDLDLRDGHCRFAAAGEILAFVVRPFGWESLITPQPWLGDGDVQLPRQAFSAQLQPSDWLLFIAGNAIRHLRIQQASAVLDGQHLAETLLRHNHLSASAAARSLADLWSKQGSVWQRCPNLILLKREPVASPNLRNGAGITNPELPVPPATPPLVGLDGR